jgi:hypothetical protein
VHVLKHTDGGAPVELHLTVRASPIQVIYMEDDPLYGDSANEVSFSD